MISLRTLFARRLQAAARLSVTRLEDRTQPAAPIQFFFVPMPEQPTLASLEAIGTGGQGTTMTSLTTITTTEAGTTVFFDQWEDGYETILGNPTQASTRVWGDGNDANGITPGFANDPLGIPAGTVLRLRNDVPAAPRDPANFFFDGGDRVGADKTIAMSRAQFPVTGGSVITSSVEVRDSRYYGTGFTAPVGVNTPGGLAMFEYTAFYLMAAQDGTVVQVDADADGTFEQTATLNRGQNLVVSGLNQGARATAGKPLQAHLLTGDIGSGYASRSYALFADGQLANDYFTAVGDTTADPVRLYVYNPTGGSITVNFETQTTSGTVATLNAGESAFFDVPADTGTRLFTAGGEVFAALGAHDAGDTIHDWGFSLQPLSALSQVAVVGLGVGDSASPPSDDTSPIWVTAARLSGAVVTARVYVDYDGDPTTGPLTDPNGNQYDLHLDLDRLQAARVSDPNDNDASGMRLYTLDGTLISTTWGEGPDAPTGSPGFDAGTTVPAMAVPEFYKFVAFAPGGDANADGYFNSGDTLRYSLRIRNIGSDPIALAVLTDALPAAFVTYVLGSTVVNYGSGDTSIPDSGSGTPFPLDAGGYTVTPIVVAAEIVVFFDVTINAGLPTGTTTITNAGTLAYDVFSLPAVVDADVRGTIGDTVFQDANGNGTQNAGEPGIAGVTVRLLRDANGSGTIDGGDVVVATVTTDANGNYRFTDLAEGDYLVDVTDTGGVLAGTTLTAGTDPRAVALGAGAIDNSADFGYQPNGSIGDRVWYDLDGDGVQDPAEATLGVPGVEVVLDYAGADGTFGTGDDVTGQATATTDANGIYTFPNLPPGTYRVRVLDATVPVDGLTYTTTGGNTRTTTITSGTDDLTNDFGVRGAGGIGDHVFLDVNGNGTRDAGEGLVGVVVRVSGDLDGDGTVEASETLTATTGANGVYSFSGLRTTAGGVNYTVAIDTTTVPQDGAGNPVPNTADPDGGANSTSAVTLTAAAPTNTVQNFGYQNNGSGVIGDRVFLDLNGDGVWNAGEGISGVVVYLTADIDGYGTAETFTATTDADGFYQFANLPVFIPDGSAIAYTVAVNPADLPAGVAPSSDADGTATPNTTALTLVANANRPDIDFGYRGTGSVGGVVYEDRNANGVQDPFEPGIAGVQVVLSGTDARGPVNVTAFTDATGNYTFPNLLPGTYTLTQTQPAGYGQGQNAVGTAGGTLGGTDVIRTITLAPGVRAVEYRFGEVVRVLTPQPAVSVEAVQPWEQSKKMFLSSTTTAATGSVPNFAALGSVSPTRPLQFVATAGGPGNTLVRVFDLTNGVERFRFDPFPGFGGGVRTAVADVTGDGIPDVIAAAGPGGGPAVVVYNGDTGSEVVRFFAFEAAFPGGVFVAAADFDRDGRADVVVGADRGGGPRVRVLSAGNPDAVLADFWGIDDVNFRGGVRVAAGDINGDGIPELVAAAGSGGSPRVAGFDGRGIAAGQPVNAFPDFFAFETGLRNGAYVAVGDVDGDGRGDVITGAGEGGGPRVSSFSGRELTAGRQVRVGDVWAFDPAGNTSGARVAAVDLDGDGRAEVLAGTGPGVRPTAAFFDPRSGRLFSQFSPDWLNAANGIFVG